MKLLQNNLKVNHLIGLMSKLCLNCSNVLDINGDFCKSCEDELNEVVDGNETELLTDMVNVKSDPFFQSKSISNDMIEGDDELIAYKIRRDTSGGSKYWLGIFVIITTMIIIAIVNG